MAMEPHQALALQRVYEVLNIVSVVALVPTLAYMLSSKEKRAFPSRLMS